MSSSAHRKHQIKYLLILLLIGSLLSFCSISTSAQIIREGDRGAEVEQIQEWLSRAGYDLEVDGIFGGQTTSSVKSFQSDNNLRVDGVVGPETKEILKNRIEDIKYEVKRGDSLSHIASRFDTTVQVIREANNLRGDTIRIGDELTIPRTGKGGVRAQQNNPNIIHSVKPGDNLSRLSKKY